MAYELRYTLEFKNELDQTCLLEIYKDTTDPPVLSQDLTGSSRPIIQRGIDNDRNIFKPIRGQELVAEIVTDTLSIDTFIADDETTWKGVYKVNGQRVFEGLLLQEDSSEDFVDYKHIITLTFTDSLALLKGVEFTDNDGDRIFTIETVYDIIKLCLNKTGLTLDIDILCNIFPSATADVTITSAFSLTKLYTKSFQKDEREFIDCYDVLSRIMISWGCVLYQYRGKWVIERMADRMEQSIRAFSYDVNDDVTYVGTTITDTAIGENEDIKEVEQPLRRQPVRTSSRGRINYRFENWPELIRNLDLDEGSVQFLLSDSNQTTYSLDHYTQVSRTAYWRKELDPLGNEEQRYMFINGAANNLDLDKYVLTGNFPGIKGDKIEVTFSACSKNELAGTAAIVYVKCGSYFLDDDGTWSTGATFLRLDWASAEFSVDWKTYNLTSEELPVNGDIEMRLLLMQGCGVGNETRYKDIRVSYIPVINNAQSARGDYNEYPNSITKKNPSDETVFVSDALKKVFKGALLDSSGNLLSGWKRGGITEEVRFSQLNALGYYQNKYRSKNVFEGSFRGVDENTGLRQQLTIADVANKKFAIVSLNEINWKRCVWQATLAEVYDSVLDADISTPPDTYVYNFVFL